MTNQTVPALSFVMMGISLIFAVMIPVGLFIFYRKKYDAKIKPFVIGCATFAIFALVLEGIFHAIILGGGRAEALMAKPVLYGLYGGFMAGLFEETGRFIAFKTVLKKTQDDDVTALMYGAGHGGFEAFYLLFSVAITNIVFSTMINTGNTELITKTLSGSALAKMEETFTTLLSSNPLLFAAGIIERFPAVALHISFSVLVWFAVKNKDKWYLYPLAFVLHFGVDVVVGSLAAMKANTVLMEALCYAFAALTVFIAVFVWKKQTVKKEVTSTESVIE